MKLTILGSSSATPYQDRHPSSQVLSINNQLYLIDCGEGTLFRLNTFKIKKNKIKAIFISHLHGDHYYGLMGLLTTMSMHEKKDELTIVCPPHLEEIIKMQCSISKTVIRFPIKFIEFSNVASDIYSDNNVRVSTIPLDHKIETCGYVFDKKFPETKMLESKIKELGLTNVEISRLVNNQTIEKNGQKYTIQDITTLNSKTKSYAYCTDTRYNESYLPYLKNVTTLYHESTFLEKDLLRAIETKHSTAREAATVAKACDVNKLLIGHFSARYNDLSPLLEEAQSIFPNTDLAIEGHIFDL